ncbi:MAG: Coenzyme F420 hydrogenase/dehydrogenase, beta subunit C-terminal domain [Eubacteriales bacterium]
MKLAEENQCTGCSACASICPKQCIHMEPDVEGFLRPVVEKDSCVYCGVCQKVCPILSPLHPSSPSETSAYAAYNMDADVRKQSSSGGVFTALCTWILDRGGVVFGAVYDEDFTVRHRMLDRKAELWRLRGAKYAQSDLADCFSQVKACLTHGQHVLFSGTPCQIAGLQKYLGKSWETLLLVDVVCHGIPSPAVWKHYIRYRSENDANGARPTAINLRSKETGWPGYSIRFDYEGHPSYTVQNFHDPYLRAFVGDLCLRPSCYDCKFKGIARTSDFTLADYWGIEEQVPVLHDGNGTSLVFVHSPKATSVWENIASIMRRQKVDPSNAVKHNPSAIRSSQLPKKRHTFMSRYQVDDFTELTVELLAQLKDAKHTSFFSYIAHRIKQMLKDH